ncbi:hypothetical protein NHQ30_000985 [Ciborinia camelliae]|nr:hypothetical protein NHQ30_000985 [Ciborinia camelliae]
MVASLLAPKTCALWMVYASPTTTISRQASFTPRWTIVNPNEKPAVAGPLALARPNGYKQALQLRGQHMGRQTYQKCTELMSAATGKTGTE